MVASLAKKEFVLHSLCKYIFVCRPPKPLRCFSDGSPAGRDICVRLSNEREVAVRVRLGHTSFGRHARDICEERPDRRKLSDERTKHAKKQNDGTKTRRHKGDCVANVSVAQKQ